MTTDVTMKLYDRAFFYTSYSMSWEGLIAQTLRGSLQKTTSGSTITYADRFSGLEVMVTTAGSDVTGITISGPVGQDGAATDQVLADLDLTAGALTTARLENVFKSYANSSGASGKLAAMLDGFSYDITTVDTGFAGGQVPVVPMLSGGNGDDVFRFGGLTTFVFGSRGNDTYMGSASGGEVVDYSMLLKGVKLTKSGTDRMIEKADGSVDTLTGIDGLTGTEKGDKFKVGLGAVNAYVQGMGGNDLLGGGTKADALDGGDGNDKIYGRNGDDLIFGGTGDDVLNGGNGDDILFGSMGYGASYYDENDVMIGGKGSDLFVLETSAFAIYGTLFTTIKDFKNGTDFIGLIGSDFTFYDGAADNLVFSDLDIRDSAEGAVISVDGTDIALVEDIAASQLTRRDFVEMVNMEQLGTQFFIEHEAFLNFF